MTQVEMLKKSVDYFSAECERQRREIVELLEFQAKDKERMNNLRNTLNEALSCCMCGKACLHYSSFRYCQDCNEVKP